LTLLNTVLDVNGAFTMQLGTSPAVPSSADMSHAHLVSYPAVAVADLITLQSRIPAFRKSQIVDPGHERRIAYETHEREGIVRQARRLKEYAPESVTTVARLAQALLLTGSRDEAAIEAREVFRLHAREALEKYKAASEMLSWNAPSLYVAAMVLAGSGKASEAEVLLSKTHGRTGPLNLIYAALAEQRRDHAEALARLSSSVDPETASFRGYLLLRLGRFGEAIHNLRIATRGGSPSLAVLMNLAYTHAALGYPEKAVRSAREAVATFPLNREASSALCAYLSAVGEWDAASSEAERSMAASGGYDPKFSLILSQALLAKGDLHAGIRVLRRSVQVPSSLVESGPLADAEGTLAFLEWRAGSRSRSSSTDVVLRLLRGFGGGSIYLARVYSEMLDRIGDFGDLPVIKDRLEKQTDAETVLPLTVKIGLLAADFERATEDARRWTSASPLDPRAAGTAIILLSDAMGDSGRAAHLGLDALKRMPGNSGLRNDVAYALVFAGHLDLAREVIRMTDDATAPLVATRGLIELAAGNVSKGLQYYDDAARLGGTKGQDHADPGEFVSMLRIYEAVSIHRLGLADRPEVEAGLAELRIPKSLEDKYMVGMLRPAAERAGMAWPGD